jgi:hypothetical protein
VNVVLTGNLTSAPDEAVSASSASRVEYEVSPSAAATRSGSITTSCGTPACAPFLSIREENAATCIAGRQPGRHRHLEAAAEA